MLRRDLVFVCRLTLCAAASQVVLAPAPFGYAAAQEDKKAAREREALRRAQQALRKAEEEKAALGREKSAIEEKLKAADARTTDAERKAARLFQYKRKAEESETEVARQKKALAEALAASQAKFDELARRFAALGEAQTESLRTLNSRDMQIRQLQASLLAVRGEVGVCEAKNAKLYVYGGELMRLYRDKTAFESMRQAEPLTGIGAVGIENILEEYRDKLAVEKIGR